MEANTAQGDKIVSYGQKMEKSLLIVMEIERRMNGSYRGSLPGSRRDQNYGYE